MIFGYARVSKREQNLSLQINALKNASCEEIYQEKKINFKSLTEGTFDTTSSMGEAIFQIIAILKAMEVNVLRERTVKGLEAARLEGRIGGRPAESYNKKKASAVVTLYKQKNSK
jgi:DNA invertase Pin-like site-specific DNA recombinase